MPEVLVTGGAGYIGSHILCALAAAGRRSISIDNYSNSSPESIARVNRIAPGHVEAFEADIRNAESVRRAITGRDIDCVIHLAGLKAVGESVEFPERYFDNNVEGTRKFLEVLRETRARQFIFSSSATVYGLAGKMPIDETAPTEPQSPYGQTKLDVERMLERLAVEDPSWRAINLRYFNPVGAHESGSIGEDPAGTPNNLMPYVCQVASGLRPHLQIFGNDYPTPDGTGVRDFIHVLDLAEGHVAALDAIGRMPGGSVKVINLGPGRGYSVLELVSAFERMNGVRIPYKVVARRPGDIAACYANCARAKAELGWTAKRGIEEMVRDAWRWQKANPRGYK